MNIFPPTRSSIVSAIKTFATSKSLTEGKSIHARIIRFGLLPETQLYNHLLNLYSKCFDFTSARNLFDEMPELNLISYSTLISGYSQSNTPEHALRISIHLHRQSIELNQYVFSSLILACSKLNYVKQGKQIHAQVLVSDFGSDQFVKTNLVELYSKSGDLKTAFSVFRAGIVRDSVMYNSMISGFVTYGLYEEAVELFSEARMVIGLKPSEFTLGSVIKACSNLSKEGEQIHGLVMKIGFESNCIVGTSLVDMYGKFDDMESAEKIFRAMENVDLPLYNSMIVGFSHNNMHEEAMEFFDKVIFAGFSPNEVTFSSVLKSCGGSKCINLVKIIHGLVTKSVFFKDLVVNTAMFDAYMKCGLIMKGFGLFGLITEKNVILYNSMINGLGQSQDHEEAIRVYITMKRTGIDPNSATFVSLMNSSLGHERSIFVDVIKHGFEKDLMVQNAILDSFIKGGFVDEARILFNTMRDKNVISWTSIISGLSELGLANDAFTLFNKMNSQGISPNSFTFSSVFKACGSIADLEKGKLIHACSIKHGVINDEYTNSSLVDMYARCGALDESYKIFNTIPKNDVVLWNSMITAFSRHGKGKKALQLLKEMENHGIKPNDLSFTSLLSACSHCGLIEEGASIFESISSKYNKVPLMEHYACMVDIFGRARMLERAKSLIESMPFKADKLIWETFLAACKLHGDVKLAEYASNRVLEDGDNNTTIVSLSNIYSELGRWDDVERVRRGVKEGCIKEVGLSWVQIRD